MKKLALAAFILGAIGLAGSVQADDKKADPTGTWKWSIERNGQKRDVVAKLTVKNGKVTGTVGGGKTEAKIDDGGTFKDGKISFTVTREFKDQKFTTKYNGTVTGDTIKGKMEGKFNDKEFSNDWEAKKDKATKD
jgi:hypothetical protein